MPRKDYFIRWTDGFIRVAIMAWLLIVIGLAVVDIYRGRPAMEIAVMDIALPTLCFIAGMLLRQRR